MKKLFDYNNELKSGNRNYIYVSDNLYHAYSLMFYLINQGIAIAGFVQKEGDEDEFGGLPVITLSAFAGIEGANIILKSSKWQDSYDLLFAVIDCNHIYVDASPWLATRAKCAACANDISFAMSAFFAPFLQERMFGGQYKPTMLMHCPACGMYYSQYRPTDDEMALLYKDYRGEEYQKQRQRYEPGYTVQKNANLYEPADGGGERMSGMISFISEHADVSECRTVLDFGGDKGQFIPSEFVNAKKYVYEISGPEVVDGVELLTDYNELGGKDWDIILCNMVMEHLSDVKTYFSDLVRLMGEDTLLYIEVPNEHYLGDNNYAFIHEHINFFTERSFMALAGQNGVRCINVKTEGDVLRCLIHR